MDDNYLYHYYEAETGPFKNLSTLSYEEALSVQDTLKQDGGVFASQRSDDYLLVRRQLEELARELFISKGGKPTKAYPHYMTFGACNWLKEWYRDGKELRIPLEEFDPMTISFTYGDLFPTMRYKDGKPYRERIYLKHEIIELVKEIGRPQIWNPNGNKGPERYIEVQIWDEKVINKYL